MLRTLFVPKPCYFAWHWLQELREQWYELLAGDAEGAQPFSTDSGEADIAPFADLRLPDSLRSPVIAAARKARHLSQDARK